MMTMEKSSVTAFRFTFFILIASPILLFYSSCVVTAERGPYYREPRSEAAPRPVDLRRIEGQWFINVDNNTGKLQFYRSGNMWGGRIWFDVWQQWEDLTDIIFDPRTGYLGFTRPGAGQRFSGTLTRNQIVGTYVWGKSTYSWEARRELVRPAIGIEGQWLITANNSPGKLEFSRVGKAWGGRIWFDVWGQWEALTDIRFNARTGELQFARPGANQIFSGTLSGNQIVGNYLWGGSTYSWQGRRP